MDGRCMSVYAVVLSCTNLFLLVAPCNAAAKSGSVMDIIGSCIFAINSTCECAK